MKLRAFLLALVMVPSTAMADPAPRADTEKTVSLTQAEVIALVTAQVAAARAQDAQSAAAGVEAKLRTAFVPPPAPPPGLPSPEAPKASPDAPR